MKKQALIIVGIVVVVVGLGGLATAGTVAFVLFAGLPSSVTSRHATYAKRVSETDAKVASDERKLDALLGKDRALLDSEPEVQTARKQLLARREHIEKARKHLDQGKRLLAADRLLDTADIDDLIDRANSELDRAKQGDPKADLAPVEQLIAIKQKGERAASEAPKLQERIAAVGAGGDLDRELRQTIQAHPDKQPLLQAKLVKLRAEAKQAGSDVESFTKTKLGLGLNPVLVGRAYVEQERTVESLEARRQALRDDLRRLPMVVDRVLIDMKSDAGTKSYLHRHRLVEDGKARDTDWFRVPSALYQKHENHLGMTILHKPKGQLEEEGDAIAGPPGLHYAGNAQYGSWKESTPKVWSFNPAYAALLLALRGSKVGTIEPITFEEWSAFHAKHAARQPFYGLKGEWGSKGWLARRMCEESQYVKDHPITADNIDQFTSKSGSGVYASSGSGYRSSSMSYRGSSRYGGGK